MAIDYIKQGRLKGYLAYYGNQVVGWCNVNEKENFERLNRKDCPQLWDDYCGKVKAIVCFCVKPEMRGKGIASQLVEYICENEKADCIEAYPYEGAFDCLHYTGKVSMFEKKGFEIVKRLEHRQVVMRRYL